MLLEPSHAHRTPARGTLRRYASVDIDVLFKKAFVDMAYLVGNRLDMQREKQVWSASLRGVCCLPRVCLRDSATRGGGHPMASQRRSAAAASLPGGPVREALSGKLTVRDAWWC